MSSVNFFVVFAHRPSLQEFNASDNNKNSKKKKKNSRDNNNNNPTLDVSHDL